MTLHVSLGGVILGLLNLRGTDIEFNPLFFSYALVYL